MSRETTRKEIVKAVELLGYADCKVTVIPYCIGRYAVQVDGERLGIWDTEKKTFVD